MGEIAVTQASLFGKTVLPGILGTALFVALAFPSRAESDIAISAKANFTTDYVFRGITNSVEKPAVQPELDLTYKEIFYAGIWGTNVDFGSDPNGQELASIEIDLWVGVAPTLGKWTVDVAVITTRIRVRSIRMASSTISKSGPASRVRSSTIS